MTSIEQVRRCLHIRSGILGAFPQGIGSSTRRNVSSERHTASNQRQTKADEMAERLTLFVQLPHVFGSVGSTHCLLHIIFPGALHTQELSLHI